jgi:hypothetical protein
MSSSIAPRRSARVVAAAEAAAAAAAHPSPAPTPAPQKDTRPRCKFFLEAKNRLCNRISCDGRLSFCADHLPPTPSEENLAAAAAALEGHLHATPLPPMKNYDWNDRDQFVRMGYEAIKEAKESEEKLYYTLCAVTGPYRELRLTCRDLQLVHPFTDIYDTMSKRASHQWSNYDLLWDYLDGYERHGYIAGERRHEYFCEVCCKECFYTSNEQPDETHCPACKAAM